MFFLYFYPFFTITEFLILGLNACFTKAHNLMESHNIHLGMFLIIWILTIKWLSRYKHLKKINNAAWLEGGRRHGRKRGWPCDNNSTCSTKVLVAKIYCSCYTSVIIIAFSITNWLSVHSACGDILTFVETSWCALEVVSSRDQRFKVLFSGLKLLSAQCAEDFCACRKQGAFTL